MYDELVKRLRASVDGRYEKCDGCPYEEDYPCCVDCLDKMHKQAADAIEFLQTYKVAFENIISMGGWWMVGQDKNFHRMNVPMNWPPKGTKTVEVFPLPQPPKEE